MSSASTSSIAPILAGNRRAIARAVSLVENEAPGSEALRIALAAHTGRAQVVGITGPPGAGKSTLIDALLGQWLDAGVRVAVVAVDPSSPKTGGAVLGDRVRMGKHGAADGVFIRSIAARGHLGGVTRTTDHIIDVFDAAGFDFVIVETVGAGQSEVEISKLVDAAIVVYPPGLGDDVQAIKAGILEIADILVVNKGDSPLAERTVRDLNEMLALRGSGATPVPVLLTTATTGEGVGALARQIAAFPRGRRVRRGPPGSAASAAATTANVDHMIAETAASDRLARLAQRDPFVGAVGIEYVSGGPGRARVRMRVRPDHLNFNGSCHGGATFALADTAFGLASNSHGKIAAGIDAHITYQLAVRAGELLTAAAVEVSRSRRLAVYRVDVTREDGQLVSVFTGTVYITSSANESTG